MEMREKLIRFVRASEKDVENACWDDIVSDDDIVIRVAKAFMAEIPASDVLDDDEIEEKWNLDNVIFNAICTDWLVFADPEERRNVLNWALAMSGELPVTNDEWTGVLTYKETMENMYQRLEEHRRSQEQK